MKQFQNRIHSTKILTVSCPKNVEHIHGPDLWAQDMFDIDHIIWVIYHDILTFKMGHIRYGSYRMGDLRTFWLSYFKFSLDCENKARR